MSASAGRKSLSRAERIKVSTNLTKSRRLFAARAMMKDRIRIDPSVVRGLEYYTGPVFEAELTFEIPDEDGQAGPLRLGRRRRALRRACRALPRRAGPGDRLLDRRLAAARGVARDQQPDRRGGRSAGPVVVLVLDRDGVARLPALVARLRKAGIAAELYLGDAEMNAQLKYADKRGRVRRHPGLERARRAGRPAGHDPRPRARRRACQGDQGPRRLPRIAQARPVHRAGG